MKLFYRDIEDIVDSIWECARILQKTMKDIDEDGLSIVDIVSDLDYANDSLQEAIKLANKKEGEYHGNR